jgi:hypothetical protein
VPATGTIEVDGVRANARDGVAVAEVDTLRVTAIEDSEIVLLDAALAAMSSIRPPAPDRRRTHDSPMVIARGAIITRWLAFGCGGEADLETTQISPQKARAEGSPK